MPVYQPEIIICGGSLAGSSAAIRLKKLGHDPLVLEKAKFPRAKLCGEFLGPDAFPVLQKLGLRDLIEQAAYGRIENVIFYNRNGNKIQIPLRWMSRQYPYAMAIPRENLDLLLLKAARSLSVQVLEQTRVQSPILKSGDLFTVNVQHAENTAQYHTGILLDASGRNSGLRLNNTDAGIVKKRMKTVGFQCHVACDAIQDTDLRMYLFAGGYGGIQPISPGIANLCLLLDQMPGDFHPTDFDSVIRNTFQHNPGAQSFIHTVKPLTAFNTTANLNLYADPNTIIQIGDARLTIDPFTGSGMAQALETGYLAANLIHQGIQEKWPYERIRGNYQRLYARQYEFRLKALQWFRPFLFSGSTQAVSWPVLKLLSPQLTALFR